jgi:Lon protease-like protein
MVSDGLGHERIIGMIQPSEPVDHPVPEDAPLYQVGCAGRITAFSETEDGRFLITLTGISRFRIVEELPGLRGYRRVRADYAPYREDLDEDTSRLEDREALHALIRRYFTRREIDADWKAVEAATDETLVTSLAMMCPFDPGEKQALLEASGTANRGDVLTTLMEMALRESDGNHPGRLN